MKKWLRFIVIIIIFFVIFYLLASFVELQIDFRKWNPMARGFVMICTIGMTIFGFVHTQD